MQYYPSGLPWAETAGASEQPWKYNGKEFVEMHGLDEYDSKARWYYPAICRTTTIDPLAEKYYSTSPYAWCGNNPIKHVNRNGKWIESAWDAANVAMGISSLSTNVREHNIKDAIVDGVGIAKRGCVSILTHPLFLSPIAKVPYPIGGTPSHSEASISSIGASCNFVAQNYIIPPIPPAGMDGTGVSSLMSVMTHSVVRNIPAMLAAFSRATRVTLAGSTTPASLRFSYTSLRAL